MFVFISALFEQHFFLPYKVSESRDDLQTASTEDIDRVYGAGQALNKCKHLCVNNHVATVARVDMLTCRETQSCAHSVLVWTGPNQPVCTHITLYLNFLCVLMYEGQGSQSASL